MRIGVITFPGSLDDRDARHAIEVMGAEPVLLWHADRDLDGVDAVVLPGGFSYGDYLRPGAIADHAPVMEGLKAFAADGGPVLGICNGFQILCEAGLLPGALLRNAGLRFVCTQVDLVVEARTAWTSTIEPGTVLRAVPIKNGEGRYYADEETLDRLEANGQVVFRYAAGQNPTGAVRDIAGVSNEAGNVVGLMPHPEHGVDVRLAGGTGARDIFAGLLEQAVSAAG